MDCDCNEMGRCHVHGQLDKIDELEAELRDIQGKAIEMNRQLLALVERVEILERSPRQLVEQHSHFYSDRGYNP